MGRQIMIVGNGEVPCGSHEIIDAADLVIRFNGFRSAGPAGSRTDVVAVCNTGRPAKAMLASPEWLSSAPLSECAEIWCVRNPEKFSELRLQLALRHPELDDFCDDHTDGFARLAEQRGKRHQIFDRALHEQVDAALNAFDPEPYVVPSSGMMVVEKVLNEPAYAADAVCLAGFSHQGWSGHPFASERKLIDQYEEAGRLNRLAAADPVSPSQGV